MHGTATGHHEALTNSKIRQSLTDVVGDFQIISKSSREPGPYPTCYSTAEILGRYP
jgi:hypothetical protein